MSKLNNSKFLDQTTSPLLIKYKVIHLFSGGLHHLTLVEEIFKFSLLKGCKMASLNKMSNNPSPYIPGPSSSGDRSLFFE